MPTDADRIKALEDFARTLLMQAPVRCCASAADCIKGDEEGGVVWCRTTENPAGLDAARLRLGLNRARTKTNPTGGAPKKRWLPSKDGWYELSDLAEELAKSEAESGVYLVQYADREGQPFPDEGRATLRLPEEEPTGANPAAPGAATSKPTEPRLAQHHLDELHKVSLDYRKVDAFSAETHAQGTRALMQLMISREEKYDEHATKQLQLIKTCQDIALGQAEANGKMMQYSHEILEKATKLSLNSAGPASAQVVNALGDQLRSVLQEATTLYMVRSGQLTKGQPQGPAGKEAPEAPEQHVEVARLRAENEMLRELQRLRAENSRLRQTPEPAPPPPEAPKPAATETPPPPADPVIEAEIVQPASPPQ